MFTDKQLWGKKVNNEIIYKTDTKVKIHVKLFYLKQFPAIRDTLAHNYFLLMVIYKSETCIKTITACVYIYIEKQKAYIVNVKVHVRDIQNDDTIYYEPWHNRYMFHAPFWKKVSNVLNIYIIL